MARSRVPALLHHPSTYLSYQRYEIVELYEVFIIYLFLNVRLLFNNYFSVF
jgi:hypothetical protein